MFLGNYNGWCYGLSIHELYMIIKYSSIYYYAKHVFTSAKFNCLGTGNWLEYKFTHVVVYIHFQLGIHS